MLPVEVSCEGKLSPEFRYVEENESRIEWCDSYMEGNKVSIDKTRALYSAVKR